MIDDGCESVVADLRRPPGRAGLRRRLQQRVEVEGPGPVGPEGGPTSRSSRATTARRRRRPNDPPVDCLFGNISEVNWPPLITALDGVGATPRLYGPQGNLDVKVAEQFPERDRGRHRGERVPEHRRRRVGRLPGGAGDVRRRPTSTGTASPDSGPGRRSRRSPRSSRAWRVRSQTRPSSTRRPPPTTSTPAAWSACSTSRRSGPAEEELQPHLQPDRVLRRHLGGRALAAQRHGVRHDRGLRREPDRRRHRVAPRPSPAARRRRRRRTRPDRLAAGPEEAVVMEALQFALPGPRHRGALRPRLAGPDGASTGARAC